MRIIAGMALAYVVIGGVAAAADFQFLPGAPASPAPWSGFHVGVNAGGGFGTADNDFGFASTAIPLRGALGGGQFGYNWQSGPLVFGVETDLQATALKGSISTPCIAPLCGLPLTASFSQELPWFGTARARFGYAQGGWMLYGTGGFAYAQVDTSAVATAGAATAQLTSHEIRDGWTAGAGAEMLFTPSWSVKLEYLYVDLGHATTSFGFAGVQPLNDSMHVSTSVVRAGVNARF